MVKSRFFIIVLNLQFKCLAVEFRVTRPSISNTNLQGGCVYSKEWLGRADATSTIYSNVTSTIAV